MSDTYCNSVQQNVQYNFITFWWSCDLKAIMYFKIHVFNKTVHVTCLQFSNLLHILILNQNLAKVYFRSICEFHELYLMLSTRKPTFNMLKFCILYYV